MEVNRDFLKRKTNRSDFNYFSGLTMV